MARRNLFKILPLIPKLGFANVADVARFRLAKRWGHYRRRGLALGTGEFFSAPRVPAAPLVPDPAFAESRARTLAEAEAMKSGKLRFFGRHEFAVGSPPNWFLNPFLGAEFPSRERHWSEIGDFDPAVGDIKNIWEASRFDWAPTLARAYRISGDVSFLATLNDWTKDWRARNPIGHGPQWMCGQEASLRLLNLLLASVILGESSAALADFVRAHLARVELTLPYALAQRNNHATSEAVALFVGGAWLARFDGGALPAELRRARGWRQRGRDLLERLAVELIESDGTFAQYSVNYHRLMLDTLSNAEFWRRRMGEEDFSATFRRQARAATLWLRDFVDPATGDAPNAGANDGARVLRLSGADYRDFRPSLQLAAALFAGVRALAEPGAWDEPLAWLGLTASGQLASAESREFASGGYVVIRSGRAWGYLRAPVPHFRPGQADAFHLDLWAAGQNLLRDSGSYSYNCEPPFDQLFSGVEGHNTVQFDARDQMPRLGRFLYGAWIRARPLEPLRQDGGFQRWKGFYRDYTGARHERAIQAQDGRWEITDRLSGFAGLATLRWHLAPADWRVEGSSLVSPLGRLEISSPDARFVIALRSGWESRYYQERTEAPVLEATLRGSSGTLLTRVEF